MEEAAQTVSMLVIDKKKMKIKEANLPKIVYEQTPKYMRWAKVPVVKAKIGPQIMSLVCDEKIFDKVPVKKEVKASVSGIYILDVKGLRGNKQAEPPKKQGVFKRAWAKAKEKAGVKPKEVCLVGNPGDEIAAYCKKRHLDVLVMGSHGYGRFKAAVMGSTATRIASIADVPLLIIR